MADALSKRVDELASELASTDGNAARYETLLERIRADRAREFALRTAEVERRRRNLEDPARATAADRHDLMIALERLSLWYSNPKRAFLYTSPDERAIAREREIALDAEYRERYLATKSDERSDLEDAEFASWSVREAEAELDLAQQAGAADQIIASRTGLQDAISREVELCIEQMWRNSGDMRVHERLTVIQGRFLHPETELDTTWKAQMSERIADLVVAPARAARAERRLPPSLAAAVRVLRLGSMSRSASLIGAEDAQAARALAGACVQEANAVIEELERGAMPSRRLAEAIEAEIQLASEIGVEHAVEAASTLPDALKALSTKPR
jgi:hypothetical protein